MGSRRSGPAGPRAATSRMGTIILGWEGGRPMWADNPRGGNRAHRRGAAGISREPRDD
jgi:hypothetical protein